MPSHSPNHLLVRIVNSVQHSVPSRALCQPEDDLPIMTSTCKQFFFVRMPGNDRDLVFMTFEAVKLGIALADVKHFALTVATSGQEPVFVHRVPSHLVDGRIVRVNLVDTLSTLPWVPDLNILVFAAREDQRFFRVPVARFNVGPMLRENEFLS